MSQSAPGISILGAPLSLCDEVELLATLREAVAAKHQIIVLSGNVHAYNLAYEHPWLCALFKQADVVRLDGVGVRIGARLLGYDTPRRMTWADFGWSLAAYAAEHNLSLYLLGSKPGVAEAAAARLVKYAPTLRIAGVQHGYFDKQPGSVENEAVLAQINAAKPDILIVGLGMPLQERWLVENRSEIEASVVITGGAVFDYISGELRRAPRWMTDHGLEWLGRLLIEPRRLWRRYVVGNPLFLWRVLKQRFGLLRL